MTYNLGIPAANNTPAADQPRIQQNFTQIATSYNTDHIPLSSGSNAGYSNKLTLVTQGSDPGSVVGSGIVYTKGTPSQLFFENVAGIAQLTASVVNDGSNGTVSSEYTIVTPFSFILKFGLTAQLASGSTVTLVSAFPNNFLGIVVTPRLAGTSSSKTSANILSTSTFTYTNDTGGNQNAYFFAWGN